MTPKAALSIDVISDVVCPWCFVGQRNLEHARARLDGIDVFVRWRPFQLDPTIPPEGQDRESYMRAKFGNTGRMEAMYERLREIGADAGTAFDFAAIKVSPNTLDAHRLIRWAAAAGEEVQGRLVGLLFRFYFEQGRNIGDHAVLLEAAREAGMDVSVMETLLATAADRTEVETEIATAQRMGVTGVPCFLLEGRYALMGAQSPDALAEAIVKASEAKARGELNAQGS